MGSEELSRTVAEIIGDNGFHPGTCVAGHYQYARMNKIGDVCRDCRLVGDGHGEKAADHPEWRIQRGEPRHYADDVALAASAEREVAIRLGAIVRLEMLPSGPSSATWQRNGEIVVGLGLDEAQARCEGIRVAAQRWVMS
jgi:hypothetical protein